MIGKQEEGPNTYISQRNNTYISHRGKQRRKEPPGLEASFLLSPENYIFAEENTYISHRGKQPRKRNPLG